jgi:hypothetical protein
MQDHQPSSLYKQRINQLTLVLAQLKRKRYLLGWTRFIVFTLAAIIAYKVFVAAGLYGLIVIGTGLAVLLFLVSVDVDNNLSITNTKRLLPLMKKNCRYLTISTINGLMDLVIYLMCIIMLMMLIFLAKPQYTNGATVVIRNKAGIF